MAVLAERLRRTLKARVRKSVGSIPTDCRIQLFLLQPGGASFFIAVNAVRVACPGIVQLAERKTVAGDN